jgi:ABC-type Na+ efflux pump permease subunit
MINLTHLRVLLKKDLISLWRSKGFMLGFILFPFILMYSFYILKGLVDNGPKSGQLINDYFRFSSNKPWT